MISKEQREQRLYKKHLLELTNAVSEFLNRFDELMTRLPTRENGRVVARLSNQLDLANDSAMYFGLDYSFKKIAARKEDGSSREENLLPVKDEDDNRQPTREEVELVLLKTKHDANYANTLAAEAGLSESEIQATGQLFRETNVALKEIRKHL